MATANKNGRTVKDPLPDKLIGYAKCYNFLTNNEYCERTFGLVAFLLRAGVGDINYFNVFEQAEILIQAGKTVDFLALLNNIRTHLPNIDASIEKCLMLNRLITYIEEDQARFMKLFSDVYEDIKKRLTNDQQNQIINYPENFRRREHDFIKRKNAQDMQHLFYQPSSEANAPNLIHLQNRTTDHLRYVIDTKMRYDAQFRQDKGLDEIMNILITAFMIIAQPHFGATPVLVYERKGDKYLAKVSVKIICLLNDLMETHPNMIKLDDFQPVLIPKTKSYRLANSTTLSWKKCRLQINPREKPYTILYAELSEITIEKTCSKDQTINFHEDLHKFTFNITVQLNIPEYKISKVYQAPLESLPFGIAAHHNQIPYFLTKVILDHTRYFSKLQTIDIETMKIYLFRYFIHRTGVEPKRDLQTYVEKQLQKCLDEKKDTQLKEDPFLGFLVQFVQQVEYMGKHPILSMFYDEGIFLGPCDRDVSAEVLKESFNSIKQLSETHTTTLALRFNTIKVDYKKTTSMKPPSCTVRLDIYNGLTDRLKNGTFDAADLYKDIFQFVLTSNHNRANCLQMLSTSNLNTNNKISIDYKYLIKYRHERLRTISNIDSGYKPIINVIAEIEDDGYQLMNSSERSSNDSTNLLESIFNGYTSSDDNILTSNEILPQIDLPPLDSQLLIFTDNDAVFDYALQCPEIYDKFFEHFRNLYLSSTQQIPSIPCPNQQISPQLLSSSTISNQFIHTNGYDQFSNIQTSSQQNQDSVQTNAIFTDTTIIDQALSETFNGNHQIDFNDTNGQ